MLIAAHTVDVWQIFSFGCLMNIVRNGGLQFRNLYLLIVIQCHVATFLERKSALGLYLDDCHESHGKGKCSSHQFCRFYYYRCKGITFLHNVQDIAVVQSFIFLNYRLLSDVYDTVVVVMSNFTAHTEESAAGIPAFLRDARDPCRWGAGGRFRECDSLLPTRRRVDTVRLSS